MTTWFLVVVLVLAMGGIALVAAGRGAPMADEYDDRPDALVPAEGDLGPDHLRRVRFTLGLRGYRMSEVDALLSRLAAQLEADQAWRPPAEPAAEPTAEPTAERADGTPTADAERQDGVPPSG